MKSSAKECENEKSRMSHLATWLPQISVISVLQAYTAYTLPISQIKVMWIILTRFFYFQDRRREYKMKILQPQTLTTPHDKLAINKEDKKNDSDGDQRGRVKRLKSRGPEGPYVTHVT